MPEMNALIEKLRPHFVEKPFPSVHYKSRLRPNFYIDPKKSIVVSVKASEITYSPDSSGLNYNLRFPRITKIREDKNYNDIMTVPEFHELREACKGKLAKRTDGMPSPTKATPFRKRHSNEKPKDDEDDEEDGDNTSDDEPESKRSKAGSVRFVANRSPKKAAGAGSSRSSVAAPLKPVIKEDIFKNKVFLVYGPAAWKTQTEQDLICHGGQIVQNPVRERFYIVGALNHMKVEQAFRARKYDILKIDWISRCITAKKEVPFLPSDFVSYTKETDELFKNDYDKFGDSYTKKLSLDETKQLVNKVLKLETLPKPRDKDGNSDSDSDTDDESTDTMDRELFPGREYKRIAQYRFFKDVKVAFRGPVNAALAGLVEFYGGSVASDEEDDGENDRITHVVVENSLSPRKRNQFCAILVRPKWIQDCVKAKTCLDELSYSTGLA